MRVTIKQLRGGKWIESVIPVSELDQLEGTDTVAILSEGVIWCGNEKWYSKYSNDPRFHCATTRVDQAVDNALQVFWGNREERQSICEADNVPQETINQVFKQYPLLYGKDTP
jgi:hypothetical protein